MSTYAKTTNREGAVLEILRGGPADITTIRHQLAVNHETALQIVNAMCDAHPTEEAPNLPLIRRVSPNGISEGQSVRYELVPQDEPENPLD